MYDRNGVWQQQQVTLGRSQSGKRGLFTGGYMACSLTETDNPAAVAARMGFAYVPGGDDSPIPQRVTGRD